jgi:hypothetical protein
LRYLSYKKIPYDPVKIGRSGMGILGFFSTDF